MIYLIRKSSKLLLVAIVAAGAVIRLYHLGNLSLFYDELYTVWAIRLPLASLIWEIPASGHPPLYYLFSHFWFMLGDGDAWVRSVSWACGVLSIWLAYLIGRDLFSKRVGLWASAIASVSPFLVWFSQDATDYSWFIAALSLSFYLLVRCLRRGGIWNWTAYSTATIAVLFSHYYSIFILLAEAAFFLVLRLKKGSLRAWLLSQLAITMAFPPWIFYSHSASSWAHYNVPAPGKLLEEISLSLPCLIEGFVETSISRKANLLTSLSILLAIALLLGSVASLRRVILERRMLALALFTMVALIAPVTVQLMRASPVSIRHYSPAIIGLVMMVAAVLGGVERRRGMAAGVLLLFLLAALTIWQFEVPKKENWRAVMATVSEQQRSGDIIMCFPLHHCIVAASQYLDRSIPIVGGFVGEGSSTMYYLPRGIQWTGYPSLFSEDLTPLFKGDLADRFGYDTGDATRVWLIGRENEAVRYQAVGPAEAELKKSWTLKQEWSYLPFVIKLYER